MKLTRRQFGLGGVSLLALSAGAGRASAFDGPITDLVEGTDEFQTAVEAYIYGYPLVTMEYTRRIMTNAASAEGSHGPMGTLVKLRKYPDASFTDITAPNADTLYTTAWLDVGSEPWVLAQPDMGDRYFLLPMLSGWTDVFAVPGKRTTGGGAKTFLVTGPGWTGTVPDGMTELKSPTDMVWLLGRIYCTGTPEDYAAVHALQDAFKLQPLSTWGKDYTPPAGKVDPSIDMKTPPVEQVARMTTEQFFNRLAMLMKDNPPPAAEAPILAKLAKIGIVPGQKFDPSKLDPAVAKGLSQSLPAALSKLSEASSKTGAPVNGWRVPPMVLGRFGSEYGVRAVVALVGLGANLPEDAVYPSVYVDADGKPLDAANRYVIHFAKDQTPPVHAFWSITMYDPHSFFVPNSINRYAVSSWMPLVKNADGSIDIYVQATSPGKDKEANWLPAPASGAFNMTMRMYWPTEKAPSIIDGSWKPPVVKKAM